MDVNIEPPSGRSFTIEVGYFDTVQEIKEKIEKEKGLPVSKQTLIFNGETLPDELNIHFSDILDRSSIQLQIEGLKELHDKIDDQKIHLLLKSSPSSKLGIALEVDPSDTIRRIKERIHEMDGVPINQLVLRSNGKELHDQRLVRDYDLSDRSEVEIGVKSSPATSSSIGSAGNARSARKIKVIVVTRCGTKKIPVEVSSSDQVEVLRKELEQLEHRLGFQLPAEGYFFIHNQSVMEEDRSFRWHDVREGDIIDIFNGTVTSGPP